MSETAARSRPISALATRREALIRDLETSKASLSTLQEELKSASGADKNRLLWMIKNEAASFGLAQKNLDSFENPIVLPHLTLARVTVEFHPGNKQFDATVWVSNDGILPALDSFELDLSVSYYTYEQDPPLYESAVFQKTTPASTDVQPGGTNPFLYTNIPFITKPGSSSALYTFDVLLYAGPGGVVADQNLHVQFLLRPPVVPRPIVPVSAIAT